MGKLKGRKIPRKLKKEFHKIECIEQTQPHWRYPNEMIASVTKMIMTYHQRVKLKDGAKRNKWTKRLVNRIIREQIAFHAKAMDNMIKRQMEWMHQGVNPINSFAEAMKRKSPDEFRREYLNEPIFEPKFHGMHEPHGYDDAVIRGMPELGRYARGNEKPNFMIMDDLDDLMPDNIRTKREQAEWIERQKLWVLGAIGKNNGITNPTGHFILKINPENVTKEEIDKFAEEWNKQLKSGQPITITEGTEVEFIPAKRPHRLHNHPKMEMDFCNEQEVIVDVEYINMFNHRPLYNGKNGEIDPNHIIVLKDEYLARIEESRETSSIILNNRYEKRKYLDEVITMLSESYSGTSEGFLYRNVDKLLYNDEKYWKLLFNPKSARPKAIIIMKDTPWGKKVCMSGSLQTKEAKRMLIEEFHDLLKRGGVWAEVSDKIERWLNGCGLPKIDFAMATQLLPTKELTPLEDEYHYQREIQGYLKTKVIYGILNKM